MWCCFQNIQHLKTVWSTSESPHVLHLHRLLLLTSSTLTSPAVVGLWLIGYNHLRCCEFTDWLWQHCSCQSTKDSNGQVTMCVECCCMHCHWHSEVWPWPGPDNAWRTSLARHSWLGVFKLAVTVCHCEWSHTTIPDGPPLPGRQCRHSAASAFHQPSTTCSTSLPAKHLQLSGLFSCQPHSLELSPRFHPGPDHQCRLFQTFA